jgi:hypothetical protein
VTVVSPALDPGHPEPAALTRDALPPQGVPATYGELLTAATATAEAACTVGSGPFHDPRRAADTATDFVRFLGVAGRHASWLLSAPTRSGTSPPGDAATTEAVRRLAQLDITRVGGTSWARCGDQLGAAHDLLATHLSPRGEHRTPDAAQLADPVVRVASAQRVLDVTGPPLAIAPALLAAVAAAQPSNDPPLSWQAIARLRRTTTQLRRLLTAADPSAVGSPHELEAVDSLIAARPRIAEYAGPDSLSTGLQALAVLRLLSHRQAVGEEQTNPHSLHDLSQLAMAACTAAEQLLGVPSTPLARVHRAAALDRLHRAAELWEQVDRQVYPRLRAVARAPRVYRDAITFLTGDCATSAADSPSVVRAVLAALPRLATDASQALLSHAGFNGLAAARRDPGQLAARWRPLEPSAAAALAAALVAAGRGSRTATIALCRCLDAPTARRTSTVPGRPAPAAESPRQRLYARLEATP